MYMVDLGKYGFSQHTKIIPKLYIFVCLPLAKFSQHCVLRFRRARMYSHKTLYTKYKRKNIERKICLQLHTEFQVNCLIIQRMLACLLRPKISLFLYSVSVYVYWNTC